MARPVSDARPSSPPRPPAPPGPDGSSPWPHAARLRRGALLLLVTVMLGLPAAASAHVKWFTTTNVHDVPRAPGLVLSPTFLAVLAAATLLVFAGFLLDGWVAGRRPGWLSSGPGFAAMEERLVRAATGAYFICISDTGGVILTPELTSPVLWIRVVQFAIAFLLIWRPTCMLSALGVLVLYVFAIDRYGIFHLTDYVFFPCLAAYLAALSLPWPRLQRLREPLLVGGLAFSLAWTAIEKFLYPQWTAAVVAQYPAVAFGLPAPFVTVVAGFVEFTLAFYLVTGRGLLRLGGFGYALIFAAAMPVFGRRDVYGHLVIIAVLATVVLRGTTSLQDGLQFGRPGIVANSARITLLYLLSLTLFVIAYYAMQKT